MCIVFEKTELGARVLPVDEGRSLTSTPISVVLRP